MKLVRRFLHAQPGSQAAEHLELAVGEPFVRHPLEARVDEGGEPLGECIADITASRKTRRTASRSSVPE
jgi:hypothetical protein